MSGQGGQMMRKTGGSSGHGSSKSYKRG